MHLNSWIVSNLWMTERGVVICIKRTQKNPAQHMNKSHFWTISNEFFYYFCISQRMLNSKSRNRDNEISCCCFRSFFCFFRFVAFNNFLIICLNFNKTHDYLWSNCHKFHKCEKRSFINHEISTRKKTWNLVAKTQTEMNQFIHAFFCLNMSSLFKIIDSTQLLLKFFSCLFKIEIWATFFKHYFEFLFFYFVRILQFETQINYDDFSILKLFKNLFIVNNNFAKIKFKI